jgi:hypothetical protein
VQSDNIAQNKNSDNTSPVDNIGTKQNEFLATKDENREESTYKQEMIEKLLSEATNSLIEQHEKHIRNDHSLAFNWSPRGEATFELIE